MAWTSDQLKAIKTKGGKILVSAAAGSGKTAVLSERVLNNVLSGMDIDKMLIVTFTEAAALEMKERIKNKLEEECSKQKDNKHLFNQLSLIEVAKITTMDSFYSELVKDNFDKLDIMPDFSILTNAEEKLLKNNVIKSVLSESFDDGNYIKLLNILNVNNKDLIKDKVISIESFLSTIPFYKDCINDFISKYDGDYYKDLYINSIKENMYSYKKLYEEISVSLKSSSSDFDKLDANISEEENIINSILKCNSFDDISNIIKHVSFSRLVSIRGHNDDYIFNKYKMVRDSLKTEINKKLNFLICMSDQTYIEENKLTKNSLITLFDVVIKFKERLLLEKKKINKYSFSDIPLFVIELLYKDNKKTNLANEISDCYDEILIDEYQDTNKLQSVIFNAISKNMENLFLVGDIKQSIYRFRSACPEIFNNDKNSSFNDRFPMLITLSKNFRSRDLVLDFCNYIFETIMSDEIGEVEYNDLEKLYPGATFLDNSSAISEVDIIDFESKDENDDMSKVEKEASYVANRVKTLLDDKYQVYDKNGYFRCVRPSDIAILSRSLSDSEIYVKALKDKDISVYCNKDLVFFDNYDVKLIIAILKVVDNIYDDISLMTVLKSKLFNVTDNEIALTRLDNKYCYLYDSIRKSNNINLNNILDIISDIKVYALSNSLPDILNYIYNKLDVINIIGTNKNKIKNLNIMINNAKEFSVNGKSLHEFVTYIEEILLDKSSFAGANPLSDGDNVLISTIHKSKGLEYPIVFLVNTGKKFNEEDFKNDYLIDSNYGIAFDLFEEENKYTYETISKMVLKDKMKLLMLSEELRILYVALTRAKEKIIITGTINNLSKNLIDASYLIGDDKQVDKMYLKSCNSYLKFILASLIKHKEATILRDYADISCNTYLDDAKFKINIINSNDIASNISADINENICFKDEIITNYVYNLVPEHLSVSDIKNADHSYLRKPYFLNSEEKGTTVGTLYHRIFELLPIKKYDMNLLKEELDKLNISNKEKSIININKIFAFLNSNLYSLLLNSEAVYKEKEIYFYIDSKYYDSTTNGKILLDGVIDLLFVYDSCYYIVDYKTDNVSDINILKDRYSVQLDLYELAIKEKYNIENVRKFIYSITLDKYIEL